MAEKNKVFAVIDGNSVAHRAFHAMPALTNKKGDPVGAAHGFMLAFLRAVDDFAPDYLAVCFDTKGGTFRDKEFAEYKAQRPDTAPDLIFQLAAIKELLPKLGVAVFALEGFEADDLIASVVKSARGEAKEKIEFYILSGDYDTLQLVNGDTKAFIINRGVKNAVMYDADKVKEKFGVAPDQIPALKALAGDSSDNIPGAPGIGPKAAVEILEKCGNLANAIKLSQKVDEDFCFGSAKHGKKIKDILLANKEKILQFQKLTTMVNDAPVGQVLGKCAFANFKNNGSRQELLNMGLVGIAKRLPQEGAGRNGTLF